MSGTYLTPQQRIRQRYSWFQEAKRLGNVSLACKRLGISCKTFYEWKHRFDQTKEDRSALLDGPRRPHHPQYRIKKSLRRRIPPLTPRLDGKVERSHQTD